MNISPCSGGVKAPVSTKDWSTKNMSTLKTADQRLDESLATVRQLRDTLIRYLLMTVGSLMAFLGILEVKDPRTDMSVLTVGSLPGYVAVALCILSVSGLIGSVLYGYRLWSFIRVFRP